MLKGREWRWKNVLSEIFEGAVPVIINTVCLRAAFVCVCVEYCVCWSRSKVCIPTEFKNTYCSVCA